MNRRKPLILSPYGLDILTSDADENFTGSSRGAAKSFNAVLKHMRKAQSKAGYQAVFFRKRFKDFEGTLLPAVKTITQYLPGPWNIVGGKNPRVDYPPNDATIFFSAAESPDDTDRFQGANIHGLLVDECQTIMPNVLERIPAIVRSIEGGHRTSIDWLANPNGPGQGWLKRRFVLPAKEIALYGNVQHATWRHPITGQEFTPDNHWTFYQAIESEGQIVRRKINVWLIRTWMNPALDYIKYLADLKSQLKDNVTLAAQWIENDWDVLAGEFFPTVQQAVRYGLTPDPYDRVLCGIDHGQRKTACVWIAVGADGVYRVFDSAVYHHMPIDEKVPMIKARRHRVDLYVIDPAARMMLEGSGARTIRRMYQEAGLPNLVLCKSNDRHAGWEALRTGFSDGRILVDGDRCKSLLESLSSLVTKENDSEDCEKDDGTDFQDDGDHLADALRYGVVNGFYIGEEPEDELVRRTQLMLEEDPYAAELLARIYDRQGSVWR